MPDAHEGGDGGGADKGVEEITKDQDMAAPVDATGIEGSQQEVAVAAAAAAAAAAPETPERISSAADTERDHAPSPTPTTPSAVCPQLPSAAAAAAAAAAATSDPKALEASAAAAAATVAAAASTPASAATPSLEEFHSSPPSPQQAPAGTAWVRTAGGGGGAGVGSSSSSSTGVQHRAPKPARLRSAAPNMPEVLSTGALATAAPAAAAGAARATPSPSPADARAPAAQKFIVMLGPDGEGIGGAGWATAVCQPTLAGADVLCHLIPVKLGPAKQECFTIQVKSPRFSMHLRREVAAQPGSARQRTTAEKALFVLTCPRNFNEADGVPYLALEPTASAAVIVNRKVVQPGSVYCLKSGDELLLTSSAASYAFGVILNEDVVRQAAARLDEGLPSDVSPSPQDDPAAPAAANSPRAPQQQLQVLQQRLRECQESGLTSNAATLQLAVDALQQQLQASGGGGGGSSARPPAPPSRKRDAHDKEPKESKRRRLDAAAAAAAFRQPPSSADKCPPYGDEDEASWQHQQPPGGGYPPSYGGYPPYYPPPPPHAYGHPYACGYPPYPGTFPPFHPQAAAAATAATPGAEAPPASDHALELAGVGGSRSERSSKHHRRASAPPAAQPPAAQAAEDGHADMVRRMDRVISLLEGSSSLAAAQKAVEAAAPSRAEGTEASSGRMEVDTPEEAAVAAADAADEADDRASAEEQARIVAELQSLAVQPQDNTVDLDSDDYPYFLEPSERVRVHHALYLNLVDNDAACLERVSKTLCLSVSDAPQKPASAEAACAAGPGSGGGGGGFGALGGGGGGGGGRSTAGVQGSDIYAETLVKGMARSLGAAFLAYDSTCLNTCAAAPSALQQHGLVPREPSTLRGTAGKPAPASDEPAAGAVEEAPSPIDTLLRLGGGGGGGGGGGSSGGGGGGQSASALPPPFSSAGPPQGFSQGDRVVHTKPHVVVCKDEKRGCSAAGAMGGLAVGDAQQEPPAERGRVVLAFSGNAEALRVGVCFDRPQKGGTDLGGLCPPGHGMLVARKQLRLDATDHAMEALFLYAKNAQPLLVYIRSAVSKHILSDPVKSAAFRDRLAGLSGSVCIVVNEGESSGLGQGIVISGSLFGDASSSRRDRPSSSTSARSRAPALERVLLVSGGGKRSSLFPNKLSLCSLPSPKQAMKLKDSTVSLYKGRLMSDRIFVRCVQNLQLVQQLLLLNKAHCAGIDELCEAVKAVKHREDYKLSMLEGVGPAAKMASFTPEDAQDIISWSVAHHLEKCEKDEKLTVDVTPDGLLVVSMESVQYGISLFGKTSRASADPASNGGGKPKGEGGDSAVASVFAALSGKGGEEGNRHEARLMSDVVPAGSLNVSFDDIGALGKVKDIVREVVLQPLQRPGLFSRSPLTAPCKGVLLFGPPGTGKTMIAKAIATSVRASFLSISAASVTSKWVGEGEKFAQAVFSLAAKIAPCIIFIDEIDGLLGRRGESNEHESARKIKNEIMSGWDGMRSHDQIMVVGATNCPQDLDEAVLRRLSRRLLVDLPDKRCRADILRVLLKHERLGDDVDLDTIASRTSGYTGSDLKNVCATAAYRPIKEYLNSNPTQWGDAESDDPFVERERRLVQEKQDSQAALDPIKMSDFLAALKTISATVHDDSASVENLRRWNEQYGESGSKKPRALGMYL